DQGHLMLGLAEDRQSRASRALGELGIEAEEIRKELEMKLTTGEQPAPRRLARTVEAKRAMRLASRLAMREGAGPLSAIGAGHLLTGILLARRGIGYEILFRHDVNRQRMREALSRARELNKENHLHKGDHHDTTGN